MKLPKSPLITISDISSNGNSQTLIYESKLEELSQIYDFNLYIAPITEAINAYLKCLHQYPSLLSQLTGTDIDSNTNTTNAKKINDIITYIIFQMGFYNYLSIHKRRILTLHSLNESFLCFFNLLIDQKLLINFY